MARTRSIALLVALGLAGMVSGAAGAAPGDLDPSFGTNGTLVTDFGADDAAQAIVVQADGKIVAAGATNTPPSNFALARYTIDGSLDATFDGDGKVTTDFGGNAAASDVVVQSNGMIVVAGDTGGDFALARYNPDGSLDVGFGVGGRVVTDFGGTDMALAVAIQGDGKIVACGRGGVGSVDFAIARYTASGGLDTSFDGDGRTTVDFGGADVAADVVLQSDRKIVAVGDTTPTSGPANSDFALARLNVDGSLDAEGLDPYLDAPFGVGGKVTTDFTGTPDSAAAVAIEPGGKLVVGGLNPAGAVGDFKLARYNVDGTLDSGFGSGGKVTTSFGPGSDQIRDVAIQRNGEIVAGGGAAFGTASGDFALARYSTLPCCLVGVPPASVGGTAVEPPDAMHRRTAIRLVSPGLQRGP